MRPNVKSKICQNMRKNMRKDARKKSDHLFLPNTERDHLRPPKANNLILRPCANPPPPLVCTTIHVPWATPGGWWFARQIASSPTATHKQCHGVLEPRHTTTIVPFGRFQAFFENL